MPTAAKLVAALILAITGGLAAYTVRPYLPEGQPDKWLYQCSILIPVVCAWRTVGRRVGNTYKGSINSGFYGVFVSIFYVLLAFAAGEMIKRSIRLRYDGPMEAITSMFGIALEYGALLLNPPVAAVLVGGAVLSGFGSEWANRRWA